jgi:endonuclease/exonuclease/phosphatase family metal-dependent hydrolase
VWELNWAHSGKATYYPGLDPNEGPSDGFDDVPSGNAQLIRLGAGIRSQRAITIDGQQPLPGLPPDQGIELGSKGRSFMGATIITERGAVDVYNTHLALPKDASDARRVQDVEQIQTFTEARSDPAVITGDFNEVIDFAAGRQGEPANPVRDALRSFMSEYGYTDVAREKGPTSNQKKRKVTVAGRDTDMRLPRHRIDFILARGVPTRDTARFESHESDHWGLVTTIDPDHDLGAGAPPQSIPPTTATRVPADDYRHEFTDYGGWHLEQGERYYFFTSADGNYICGIDAEQAGCQGRTTPVPPRPDTCRAGPGIDEAQWGDWMVVRVPDGAKPGDFLCWPFSAAKTKEFPLYGPSNRAPSERDHLRPGQSIAVLGFTCVAPETGIRCTHDASRHGFLIAPHTNERF